MATAEGNASWWQRESGERLWIVEKTRFEKFLWSSFTEQNRLLTNLAFISTGLKISYKRILRGYSMESFVSSHFVLSRGLLRDADFC